MTKVNSQFNHSVTVKSWLAASLFSVALISVGLTDSNDTHAASWSYSTTSQTLPPAIKDTNGQSNTTQTSTTTTTTENSATNKSNELSDAQEIVRVNLTVNGSLVSQTILNTPYNSPITSQQLTNPQMLLGEVSGRALKDYLKIISGTTFKGQNIVGTASISGSKTNATLTVDLGTSNQSQTSSKYISPDDVTDGSLSTTQIMSINGINKQVTIWWVEEKKSDGSTNYLAFLSLEDAKIYATEMTNTGTSKISPESGVQYDISLTIGSGNQTSSGNSTDNGNTADTNTGSTTTGTTTGSTTTPITDPNNEPSTSPTQQPGSNQTTTSTPTGETQTNPGTSTTETTNPGQTGKPQKDVDSNTPPITSNDGTQPNDTSKNEDKPIRQVSVEYVDAKSGKVLTSEILTGLLNTPINFDTPTFIKQYFQNNYIVLNDETLYGGQFDMSHTIYKVSMQQVNSKKKATLHHASMPSVQKFAEMFPTKKSIVVSEKSAATPSTTSSSQTTESASQSTTPKASQPDGAAVKADNSQDTHTNQSKKQSTPTWKKSPLSSLNVVNNPQSGAVAFGSDPDEFSTLARYFISISGKINLGSK